MAEEKISATLQTPADDSGNRRTIHLVNTEDEVIVDPSNTNNSRTLGQKLREMRPVISESDPNTSNNHKSSVLWAKIYSRTADRPSMSDINKHLSEASGSNLNTNTNQ